MSMDRDDDLAPLHFHEAAIKERNGVDFSSGPISMEVAKAGKADRPVRIYADGVFDLFHYGHTRQLMQAKKAFPSVYLIVGVTGDECTHRLKGPTVMNQKERCQSVRYCRFVDEVVYDAPFAVGDEFLKENKIDFVAHDDLPYPTFVAGEFGDAYSRFRERGQFVATERTEGISTSDLIGRILKDYNLYENRNLERGISTNLPLVQDPKFRLLDLPANILCKADSLARRSFRAISTFFVGAEWTGEEKGKKGHISDETEGRRLISGDVDGVHVSTSSRAKNFGTGDATDSNSGSI